MCLTTSNRGHVPVLGLIYQQVFITIQGFHKSQNIIFYLVCSFSVFEVLFGQFWIVHKERGNQYPRILLYNLIYPES